jgi:hypothetical protein
MDPVNNLIYALPVVELKAGHELLDEIFRIDKIQQSKSPA